MGKAASKKNIARAQAAHDADPDEIGPLLGVLVYQSNVPASAVSILLRTSQPTFYRWTYGENDVAPAFRKRVTRVISILRNALITGMLPAQGNTEQRIQRLASVVRAALDKPQA